MVSVPGRAGCRAQLPVSPLSRTFSPSIPTRLASALLTGLGLCGLRVGSFPGDEKPSLGSKDPGNINRCRAEGRADPGPPPLPPWMEPEVRGMPG